MHVAVGIFLIIASFALSTWVNKRAFERINSFGVQEFQSYWHAVGVQAAERLGRIGAKLLIIAGLLVMALPTIREHMDGRPNATTAPSPVDTPSD